MPEAEAIGLEWTLYSIGLLISGVVVSILVSFLWQHRKSRIASTLMVTFSGCALWSFVLLSQIFFGQVGVGSYPLLYMFDAARYVGLYFIVIGLLCFALTFTGREQYVTPRFLLAVSISPAIVIGVILTNDVHTLFWQQPAVPGPGSEPVRGIGFVLHSVYAYSLVALTIVMLLGFIVRSEQLYRRQAIFVVLAAVFPIAGNLVYLLTDAITIDPTPITFSISGALLLGAVYRYQLANVTPVARETVLENMEEGVLVVDENDRVTQANQATRDMLGIDKATKIGLPASEFLAENASAQKTVTRLLDSEPPETKESSLNGRQLSFSLSQMEDSRGTSIGRLIFITDVTERHERERELAQYTKLVQTVGDPMYVLDTDGCFERVNDAFVEYANLPREEILGSNATRFMRQQDYDRGTELLKQLRHDFDRRWDTYEMEFNPVDEEPIPTEAMLTPVRDPSGTVTETVCVMRDITKRKHREEQLDLLRQVFSRVLRHNLRNDMTIIRGAANRITELTEGEPHEQAETILDRSERLLSISQNARDLERVISELDETAEVDLVEVTNLVVSELEDKFGHATIETHLPASAPVDAHKMISTAIKNIVENAIVHNDADPHVTITIEATEETVTLEITDDGPGIPDKEVAVLQEGTESSLNHGSGVGLWLVNFVAQESDGEIRFERKEDRTVVTMILPAGE